MCEIVVREFEPADAEAVAGMIRDLAAFHREAAAATASDVLRYGSGPDRLSTLWVALLREHPCAFAATFDWMNYVGGFPVRNIDLFFVRADARRRGVGCTLLRSIARDAVASACRRVTVGAEPDNDGANAFYRSAGFEPRHTTSNRYVISGEGFARLTLA